MLLLMQISLLGIQFQWTADTQSALSNAKTDKTVMSKNMKKVDNVLKEMVSGLVQEQVGGGEWLCACSARLRALLDLAGPACSLLAML